MLSPFACIMVGVALAANPAATGLRNKTSPSSPPSFLFFLFPFASHARPLPLAAQLGLGDRFHRRDALSYASGSSSVPLLGIRRALHRRRAPTRYAQLIFPSCCARPSARTLVSAVWLFVFGSDLVTSY